MGVIIIIAVFWLLGLLMAWSMCVVAARADRHMEEIRNAGDGRNNERTLPAENHRGGGCLFGLILIPFARRRTRRSR